MNDSSGMPFGDEPAQTKVVTFRVVVFRKRSGILCKKISLNPDDTVKSDGSACSMSVGTAELQQHNQQTFADLIGNLDYHEAIALGAFREGIPDQVKVETKKSAARTIFPGGRPDDLIVRSADYIQYLPGQPAQLLIDVDTKAMPKMVRDKIRTAGGFWRALVETLPVLAHVGRVTRPSTSTGLSRTDTGERLPGSEGLHIYIVAEDGADINRFLRALHERLWLAGFGWMMVGRAGQFLSRSIVDRMVGDGCRLVFEAMALTVAPLVQDRASRKPVVVGGPAFDTATCPDLTVVERDRLVRLIAAEKQRMAPEAARAKAAFIDRQAARIVAKSGGVIDDKAARFIVERQTNGTLLPNVILTFDHLGEATVGEVLANPDKYVGQTLEDPLEGTDYGPCKAMIVRRADGAPGIHSFAHGEAFYSLKYDARSIEVAILGGAERNAPDIAVRMLENADVNKTEEDLLIGLAAKRGKVGKRAIGQRLKAARNTARAARVTAARMAAGASAIPEILVVPGLRHEAVDAGLAAMHAANVPFYQRSGQLVRVCSTPAKTSDGKAILVPGIISVALPMLGRRLNTSAIWQRPGDDGPVRIDCPRDVVEETGALSGDWPFPPLVGVTGTPTLRLDGSLLCAPGYDAATGLYLHEPPRMPPIPDHPTRRDAELSLICLEALLVEFPFVTATDRSVATSMLMTPVLRGALGVVPIHIVSAPDPGTGKSYLNDLSSAICIGERCPVKSVAPKEEETEKRLIGAALAGHPIIALDNCNGILSGDFLAQISERQVLDLRGLGASTMFRINNTFTCFANGNNIIYGDLTRRCVRVRLDADIEDPTSRTFKGNPVAAILADRGKYIAAVLTIALAYIAAGRPSPPHAVPSYERWSDLVCGALVWLQRPNPADSMAGLRAENPAGSDLATVLRAWPPHHLAGATTAELIDTAQTFDTKGLGKPLYPDWLAAIRPVAQNKVGQLDGLIFGKWLGANRDRMIGRRKLCRIGSDTRPKWKIEEDIPATATNAAPF